jgi:hypothetical protein
MQVKTGKQIDHKKRKTAETKFLCPVVGYTSLDQIQGRDKRSELKIFNLTDRTERQKENWCAYILRMTTERPPKDVTKL